MSASSIKSDENLLNWSKALTRSKQLLRSDWSNQNPNFLASCQMLPLSRLAAEKMTHCRGKSLEDTWRLCGVETGGTETYAAPVSALKTQGFLAQVFLKPAAAADAAVAANSPIKMKIGWKTCCWRYRKVTPRPIKWNDHNLLKIVPTMIFWSRLLGSKNFLKRLSGESIPSFIKSLKSNICEKSEQSLVSVIYKRAASSDGECSHPFKVELQV